MKKYGKGNTKFSVECLGRNWAAGRGKKKEDTV